MPFESLKPEEMPWAELKKPCRDRQHNPPAYIVISHPVAWVCPSCGHRVVLTPTTTTM
jgi:hypothetical protein